MYASTMTTRVNIFENRIKSVRPRIRKRRTRVTLPRLTKSTISSETKCCERGSSEEKILPNGTAELFGPNKPLPNNSVSASHVSTTAQPFNRYHVFSYEQLKRLDRVLRTQLAISPRPVDWDCCSGCSPTVYPDLNDLCARSCISWQTDSQRPKQSNAFPQGAYFPACFCPACPSASGMPHDCTSPDTACGNSTDCLPVLHVPLLQMIRTIRDRLRDEQVNLREIRLNGGAAGCVIDSAGEKYSDLDLIFHVDLSNPATFVKVKSVVFSTVAHFLAEAFASGFTECNCGSPLFYKRLFTPTCIPIGLQHNSTRVSSTPEPDLGRAADPCESQPSKGNVSAKSRHNSLSSNRNSNTGLRFQSQPNPDCAYRHSTCCFPWYTALQDESWLVKFYVQKMLRIHKPSLKTADSWSLFTLGYRTSSGAKTLDIKFVDRMQRQFEFTVDSFQIVLDSLLTFYETSRQEMNENFYPTVVAESVSGSFTEALSHLQERLIVTPRPEEIRGGGLLKYCKLLADGYRPTKGTDVLSMERYMCSRFFIDFPDIVSQHQRLNYYLTNHFEDDSELKAAYLQILHEVVSHSTICLMSHERQQTLCLIRMFLQGVLSKEEQQQSVVHLDAFCSEHWTLDSIFYGTTYFPKQFLMLPSAAPVCSTAAELQCGLSDTASSTPTQDDGQLTDQLPSAITAPDNSSDVDASSNHSCDTDGGNSGISMEDISLSTKQSDMRSVEASKNAPQSKKPASRANRISICQTLSDVEEEDGGLEPKVTKNDCHDDDATTATYEENIPRKNEHRPKTFLPTADYATPVNYADQPAESRDQVNKTERITESTNMIQTCPQANFTNKVYCLPQMVTYFPTPDYAVASPAVCDSTVESTVIESSKASTLPSAYTSAYGDVLSSNADISPCHAGILLPSMDLSGTMEMNHYVGVQCSDTQLAYASYVSATNANRSDPICAPSSVPTRVPYYYFEQEPNYFVYPHHMAQPTPGVLVAYPI